MSEKKRARQDDETIESTSPIDSRLGADTAQIKASARRHVALVEGSTSQQSQETLDLRAMRLRSVHFYWVRASAVFLVRSLFSL
ncbi:MAG: hypothetical protein CMJ72_13770 [Planctomycetaceae bacterium]|nr:hypothetical protein [Planctomycetaceae bacterium]